MIVKPIPDIGYFLEKFDLIDRALVTRVNWHPDQGEDHFETARTFVARFEDATVHSTPPLLITKDNLMVTDHVWPLLHKVKHKPWKSHNLWQEWGEKVDIDLPQVERHFNEMNTYVWMPIDEQSCNNPWHVWIDVISKLRLISQQRVRHMFDYVYIFPCMSTYLEKVLKEIFPEVKYYVMPKNQAWKFNDLIVPSMSNRDDGVTNPHTIQWLRTFGPQKSNPSRKIFITRKDAMTRQLVNSEELLMALAGFEPVELSQYTIKEQMEIFDSATHVVATHGAGLVNLLWCQFGTKVIEINHIEQVKKKVYPVLSDRCGLKHKVLFGEKIKLDIKEKPEGIKRINDMANIKINIQEVLKHI